MLQFFLKTCAILIGWLLLFCGDVESNPGPIQNVQWMQRKEHSNYSHDHSHTPFYSRTAYTRTVHCPSPEPESDLHSNLFSMAGYPQHSDMNAMDAVRRLESWCGTLQKDNDQLRQKVQYLTSQCTVLEQHCNNLFQWKDSFVDMAHKMDSQMDKIESFSRRNNLRFFNVYEGPHEDGSQCIRKVVQLLNRFFPAKQWTTDDVERAHRLGQRNSNYSRPRPIIARLYRWQDKLCILRAGDCRREMANTLGIRVSSDLTDRQNQVVREARDAGRHAYVWKGRLFYNNKKQQDDRNNGSKMNFMKVTDDIKDTNILGNQSHTDQLTEHCEPADQHGITSSHAYVAAPQEQDFPFEQHHHSCSPNRDLPWTADMNTFPPLPKRKSQEGLNIQGSPDRRITQQRKEQIQDLSIPEHVHGPPDAGSATITSDDVLPSKQSTDPPKPQRTALPKSKRVVDKWGVRRRSSSDMGDTTQAPSPGADSDAGSSPMASAFLLGAEESFNTAGQAPYNTRADTSPSDVPAQTASGVTCSSTPCLQAAPTAQHAFPGRTGATSPTQIDLPTLPSPVQSPPDGPQSDSSQTLAKQLTDPWAAADEVESQSPAHLPAEARNKRRLRGDQRRAVKTDQQNFSMVSETPSSHSRRTRSGTKSRQPHVTECFHRVGTGSSRTDNSEQSLKT
eukprot:TRINITY_DN4581_c0_g1_i8.p1 TRINITY_DN4581_c0_g1~~TRINITY_DN4581_c0_g1_i8.p1  ORF type:complete len:674 (-),score=116.05 TRINITY_DN4581_c0_g1_i8:159-2180(-)